MRFNKIGLIVLLSTQSFFTYANELSWKQPFSSIDSGDTAWILISAILVIFMTVPGIALFYAGMVRKKNILATMVQSFATAALVSLLWVIIGYSLAFTPGNGFIGGLDRLFLSGVNVWTDLKELTVHPNAGTIPESVFIVFQMAFAIISSAIITGAFAERMKFSALLWFIGIWVLLVYVPTAHWVWESGGWLAKHGVLDYAGGTVVHINAGVAGLIAAIVIGKRLGYGKEGMAPANLSLALMGTAILWFGWFGFNAGSAVSADGRAGMALLTTQVAAAVGGLTWISMERIFRQKPSALGMASGIVAGLVGITPATGFVNAQGAILIGILTAIPCYFMVTKIKHIFKYDDTLDAFGIHGVGGIIGAILTGVFYSQDISGATASIGAQIVGVLITVLYSAVISYLILLVLSKTIGIRVMRDDERQGLDISLHGERIE
ncbi:ammonium transporter [Neisseriaceae bacterium PsAf]|nr:ammonium transporter [Neisseriaceae bacterium PsAf]